MIEKDNRKDKNSVKSSNRPKKTIIKPHITHIQLNKLRYQYTDIKKKVFLIDINGQM